MPLVLKHRRVFIGYPAWLEGWESQWDPRDVGKALLKIDDEQASELATLDPAECGPPGYGSRITRNRNLAKSIDEGSMVVIPRLNEGVCYIGRISGRFEFVNDPSEWAADFEHLRRQVGLPEDTYQLAEVVQSWPVKDGFRAIRFPLMPKWLFLLKRDAIGTIPDRPDGQKKAIDVLERLYEGRYEYDFSPTEEIARIEARLMEWVGDRQFEQLVIEILQSQFPDQRWWHTGGPGDGGADGIATDASGSIVATLQCKWFYSGPIAELARRLQPKDSSMPSVRTYVATLYDTGQLAPHDPNVTYLFRAFLAEMLLIHRHKIPFARTIGLV